MGFNTDSPISKQASSATNSNTLHPTTTNQSKAVEAGEVQQHNNIMATIADDDDRLLARIGYTPVSTPESPKLS
jgi:hypothetical protein